MVSTAARYMADIVHKANEHCTKPMGTTDLELPLDDKMRVGKYTGQDMDPTASRQDRWCTQQGRQGKLTAGRQEAVLTADGDVGHLHERSSLGVGLWLVHGEAALGVSHSHALIGRHGYARHTLPPQKGNACHPRAAPTLGKQTQNTGGHSLSPTLPILPNKTFNHALPE